MISRRVRTESLNDEQIHHYIRSLQFKQAKTSKLLTDSCKLPQLKLIKREQPRKIKSQIPQTTGILNQFIHNYFKRKTGTSLLRSNHRSISTLRSKQILGKKQRMYKLTKNGKKTPLDILESNQLDLYFKTDWQ